MNELVQEFLDERAIPEPNSGCYLWYGGTFDSGYGVIQLDGRAQRAHRHAYRLAYGSIPDGLFVCHACDVKSCVNPAHLFLGTHDDNMADMMQKGGVYRNDAAARNTCPNGHKRTKENTYLFRGRQLCRECRRKSDTARRVREKSLQ
jgi:hypothetical protein